MRSDPIIASVMVPCFGRDGIAIASLRNATRGDRIRVSFNEHRNAMGMWEMLSLRA